MYSIYNSPYTSADKSADIPVNINPIHYSMIMPTGTVGFYRRLAKKVLRLLDEGIIDESSFRFPSFPLQCIEEVFATSRDTRVCQGRHFHRETLMEIELGLTHGAEAITVDSKGI